MSNDVPFKDRKGSFTFLEDILHSDYKIIIINSEKGIGKSRLVKEFFSKKYYEIIDCGKYIYYKGKPFEYFCDLQKQMQEKDKKLQLTSLSLGGSISPISVGIGFQFQENISDLYKDIKKTLQTHTYKIVFHIHNAQYIEFDSLNLFNTLTKEFENIILLLECNRGTPEYYELYELLNQINVHYIDYNLEKLNLEYIKELVYEVNPNKLEEVFKLYKSYGSDMHKIVGVLCRNEYSKLKKPEKEQEILMLNVVYLSKGKQSIDKLHNIFKSNEITSKIFSSSYIKICLDELTRKNILLKIDNHHYTISDYIDESFIDENYLFKGALSLLINYNMYILKEHPFCYESIYNLIYLFAITKDSRINKIYKSLRNVLPINQENYACLEKILDIIKENYYHDKKQYSLNIFEIVIIALLCHQISFAESLLNEIYNNENGRHRYLKGKILSSQGEKENIKVLEGMIKEEHEAHVWISLQLDILTLYMKYEDAAFVTTYVQSILNERKYKNMMEYIFIEKDITIYKDNQNAIRELRDCIKELEKNGYILQANRAKITLASRLTQAGFIEDAYNVYNTVLSKGDYNINLGIIKNNLGVLELLNNNISEATYDLLDEALLFIYSLYEQLLVKCNLLIYFLKCYENGEKKALVFAEQYVEFIVENYEKYKFDEYLHIVYLNLYRFFNFTNDMNNSDLYFNLLKKLSQSCLDLELKKYIQSLTEGIKLKPSDKWYFLSQFKYRPAFTGYWESGLDVNYLDELY